MIEVTEITIKIRDDLTLKLTLEEARELKAALDGIFEKEYITTPTIFPTIPPYPNAPFYSTDDPITTSTTSGE